MRGMLSPSLMCADLLNLESEITALDNLGVDYVHLDFMDGKFVPNITLDTNLIKAVKSVLKNMKRDIHIMAYQPEQYFDRMDIGKGDIVAVHYEACENLHEVIADIRSRGADPFVVISPDTKPDVLKEFLNEIDGILVMTVYPGFAGQPIVEGSFDKIKEVRKLIDESGKNIILEVDGHVSWDLCQKMRECGADLFVAGSSSVYSKGIELDEAVNRMMKLIN
ncbi:MAG: ribulose-phosphate 3-epimerase [Ruminococcus sp.]|nr:ribulose-phosphate 3-epimerase [Ruminococcus sp.]